MMVKGRGAAAVLAASSAGWKEVPRRCLLSRAVACDILGADQRRWSSSMPKLSIGLPVFNGQDFLPELLDSLLAQTFRDFEIVICDNASSDRTRRPVCEYERHDSRINYIRNERNLRANPNFNRVSTAPLFKWAAHDDLYHEAYLDACVRLFEENPDIILAHTRTAFADRRKRRAQGGPWLWMARGARGCAGGHLVR